MLRDITIGQYYSVESPIHRLDPRVKIRFTVIYIIMTLIDRNLPLFGVLTAVFLGVFLLADVPARHMLKGTRAVMITVFICSALNIFTTSGDLIVTLGGLHITYEGLVKAGFVFWRMLLIIFMSSLLMYTTTPTALTDGLEKCFHLSGSVAMGITIALRFVPVLFEEMDRIMKAQEARGADFRSGDPIRRIKSLRTVVVPLFQNSIDRASNLADAMDARCYTGGRRRTKLKPLVYSMKDVIAYLILLALVIAAVWLAVAF